MTNLVKHLKGTQPRYESLSGKGYSEDTIYFTNETNDALPLDYGRIYLGDTLVGMPSVWGGIPSYESSPLTFVTKSGSTVSLSPNPGWNPENPISLEYSLDGGGTWDTYMLGVAIAIPANGTLQFRGDNETFSQSGIDNTYYGFSITGEAQVEGNIMSLLDKSMTLDSVPSYAFTHLFYNCTDLIGISNLRLPAMHLGVHCYSSMFRGCVKIERPAELPAMVLETFCYYRMYEGCVSLKSTPKLHSLDLYALCYGSMFSGCTSLATVSELPAIKIAQFCYNSMFDGCSSLKVYSESGEGHGKLWRIPSAGPGTGYTLQANMFKGTEGDYSSTETIDLSTMNVFYTQNAPI